MPQQHMSDEVMRDIQERLTPGKHVVSLQGEGEPTLHPRFWEWAECLISKGYVPYTITNGSRINAENADKYLPTLGVSLDTVDMAEATRIGRLKLDTVLDNLDRLLDRMGKERLIIHTVDYGQPMEALKLYLRARGLFRHVVQPLQSKTDYAAHYPVHVISSNHKQHRAYGVCRYLKKSPMRYFDIAGVELPCCFIKDTREYPGRDVLCRQMETGEIPKVCEGCREIPDGPTYRVQFA